MDLRLFSLLSLLLLIFIIVFIFYRHGAHDKTKTISMHIPRTAYQYALFALALTVANTAFYLFFGAWLIPVLQLPSIFYLLNLGFFVCFIIVAWFPEGANVYGTIHRVASFGAALIMFAIITLLIFFGGSGIIAILCGATAALMLFYAFLYMHVEQARRYMLYFQGSYFLAFYATILGIAYLH